MDPSKENKMIEEFRIVVVDPKHESPPEQGILSCRLLFVVRAD